MTNLSRPIRIALVVGGICALGALVAVPASAQGDDPSVAAECSEDPDSQQCRPVAQRPSLEGVDIELLDGLSDVGFIDTWYVGTLTDPRLSLLEVSGKAADAARTTVLDHVADLRVTSEQTATLRSAIQDTLAQRRNVSGNIVAVEEHIAQLGSDADEVDRNIAALTEDRDILVGALQDAAVGMYVSESPTAVPGPDDVDEFNARQALGVQIDTTIDELLSWRDDLDAQIAGQIDRLATIAGRVEEERTEHVELLDRYHALSDSIDALTQGVTDLTIHRVEVESQVPGAIAEAQSARQVAFVPRLGISVVTLDAYLRAAERVTDYYPYCSVRWELLAGIATVESGHGTHGGGYVMRDGRVSRRILGPVLDGTLEDTKIITDTDAGSLDNNSEFDRAIGPFQFLPQTWRGFRLDATNDGWADPHNFYDAALSAAGYLCASTNVGDNRQIRRSILTYNNSVEYLEDVTSFAGTYERIFDLPDAAYDPDTITADDGWKVRFDREEAPDALANTGD